MHCAVDAHTVLVGTEDKINGKVVGGYYQLAQQLSCGQLGSPSSGVVVIKLNRQLEPIIEQQSLLRAQVSEAKALMDELKEQIDSQRKLLAGQPADPQLQMFEQEFMQQRQLGTDVVSRAARTRSAATADITNVGSQGLPTTVLRSGRAIWPGIRAQPS
ncbi:FapA family protein [Alishewanella longhuensis]